MVTKKTVNGKVVFLCDICGLGYTDIETAQKCEEWCGKNPGTCNLQISQKAVYSPDMESPK
jgi:hypothetical protein